MMYLGFTRWPYAQTPESLGMSLEEAQRTVWRQQAELDRIVGLIRARVHTGQIIAPVRNNRPDGVPDEGRTEIFMDDLIQFAAELGGAAEPLASFVDTWRRDRGLPTLKKSEASAAGRPSERKRMIEGLERLKAEGNLTGSVDGDRRLVMAQFSIAEGTTNWNVKTFSRMRKECLSRNDGPNGDG